MRERRGTALIASGLALISLSLFFLFRNMAEDAKAGAAAEAALADIRGRSGRIGLPDRPPADGGEAEPASGSSGDVTDGRGWIGRLSIPALDLELPVLADWDYEKLRTAVCRQCGDAESDNLVIAGHNSRRHFGPLPRLRPGDEVLFTDMSSAVSAYRVTAVRTLGPEESDAVGNGVHDLVLYTCTWSGEKRVAVFCDRPERPGDAGP